MINKEKKRKIVEGFRIHEKDTGSIEIQIGLLTERIKQLEEHFKVHPKDYHSKRNFLMLIHKRRKFLNYLKKHNFKKFEELSQKINV